MSLSQKLFAHGLALGDRAQHRLYGARKRQLFADVEGTVVEIGPGTGVNVPYLPEGIHWVGLEPNPHMHRFLREQLAGRGIEVDLRTDPAQDTGLPSGFADVVISTLVLCSVSDLAETLAEVRRILRPGGRLLFIEHVAAPRDTWLYTLQRGIRPVWTALADGCHPDRETGAALKAAGFSSVTVEPFDTGLPVVSPHIVGTAVV
jgi:SAM-dependent methyltransferase